MKEFKGTPGPWRIDGRQINSIGMKTVAHRSPEFSDEQEANAKLIAAAPELLYAGLELIEFAEKYLNGNSAIENSQAYENLKQVINKALS